MVKNNMYKHLLKCKKWSFIKNTIQKVKDEKYSRIVSVKSSYDNKGHTLYLSFFKQNYKTISKYLQRLS